MIRHIELVKLSEIYEGKNRAEQTKELALLLKNMLSEIEDATSFVIDTKSQSLDPVDADIYLHVDFDSTDALEEYSLNMERLAASIKVAKHAESILTYDLVI